MIKYHFRLNPGMRPGNSIYLRLITMNENDIEGKEEQKSEVKPAPKLIKKQKSKTDKPKETISTLFAQIVIGIIIVTFVGSAGSILGLKQFFSDVKKTKVANPDGTFSIQADAQTGDNFEAPELYIGRVLNEKIRIGEQNDFTRALMYIKNNATYNMYQKYWYAKNEFNRELNKIIALNNAKKMNIKISKTKLFNEIGRRYYQGKDGVVDHYRMRKNLQEVSKHVISVKKNIVHETFEREYFDGLPLLESSVISNHIIKNTKVKVEFVNIRNDLVNDNELSLFVSSNKNEFLSYKIIDVVFKTREAALEALKEIGSDPNKFIVISERFKSEEKAIDIRYPDFTLDGTFEEEAINIAVRGLANKQITAEPIQTKVGFNIILVDNTREGTITNPQVRDRAKEKYLEKNLELIIKKNAETAETLFTQAKTGSISAAAKNLGFEAEESEMIFLDTSPSFIDNAKESDVSFVATIFKSAAGTTLAPYKHDSGIAVLKVISIDKPDMSNIDMTYPEIYKNAASELRYSIEQDYFNIERKNHEIIDNFNFSITPDFFKTGAE